jgi:hypothetical protein
MKTATKLQPSVEPRFDDDHAAGGGITLARVMGQVPGGFRLRVGAVERLATLDPTVDPALVDEARVTGARVVVDTSEPPAVVIVGLLTTARPVTLDRNGDLAVRARRIVFDATERALLRLPGAFFEVKPGEIELYANRVVTRARELAKTLAAMIKLN